MHAEHPYPVLRTKVDRRAPAFLDNREQNLATLDKLRDALTKANQGGGEKYNARHLSRGKILPRQRIEMLLDRDGQLLPRDRIPRWALPDAG